MNCLSSTQKVTGNPVSRIRSSCSLQAYKRLTAQQTLLTGSRCHAASCHKITELIAKSIHAAAAAAAAQ
jgi:hypothetical protein